MTGKYYFLKFFTLAVCYTYKYRSCVRFYCVARSGGSSYIADTAEWAEGTGLSSGSES